MITGASRGIGAALAEVLGNEYDLILLSRSSIDDHPGTRSFQCDVGNRSEVEAVARTLEAEGIQVEVLINNAGWGSFEPVLEITTEDLMGMFETMVAGSMHCAQSIVPNMIEKGRGTVINICSDVSKRVFPGGVAYCSVKHAQDALTQGMRMEWQDKGIRVMGVYPGIVSTAFAGNDPDELRDRALNAHSIARWIKRMIETDDNEVIDELILHPIQQLPT
jgi:short-subunit dehydrogenase